jgi:hypothetical protein
VADRTPVRGVADVRKSRFRLVMLITWLPAHSRRILTKVLPMDAERSNTIRSQLEDLTTRVVELRRYL